MNLEEIRKLVDAVTAGPWVADDMGYIKGGVAGTANIAESVGGIEPFANARFIAASRDLVPRLLRVAEASKARKAYFDAINAGEASNLSILADLEIEVSRALSALESPCPAP